MDKTLRLQVILSGLASGLTGALRGVQAESKKTGQALAAARAEQARLQKLQADVSSYDKLQTEIVDTGMKLAAARARVRELAAQAASAEQPTARLAASLKRAKEQAAALEGKTTELGRKAVWTGAALKSAGVETDDLAGAQRRLAGDVSKATRAVTEQREKLKALGDEQRRRDAAGAQFEATTNRAGAVASAGAGATGAGAALAAPLVAANTRGKALEASATTIGQRANYSREQMAALRKEIVLVGRATNRSDEEVLAGLDAYTAAGVDAFEALALIRGEVGKAATAYQTDDKQLASMAQGASTAFGIDGNRAVEMAAYAGNAGQFEMSDTASFAPKVAATYAGLGATGEKAFAGMQAALQLVRRDTADSEAAATNLDNAFLKIGSPATQRAFEKVGVNFRAQMDAMAKAGLDPVQALTRLTEQTLKTNKSLTVADLFEDAQAQAGVRSLIKHQADYLKLRDGALASRGQVDRDFARRMSDQVQAEKQAALAAGELADVAHQRLSPAITAVSKAVAGGLGHVTAWAKENPALAGGIVTVVAALAGLLLVSGGLALAVAAVLAPFAALQFALAMSAPLFAPLIAGFAGAAGAAWTAAVAFVSGLVPGLLAAAGAAWTAAAGFLAATGPVLLIVGAVAAVIAAVWLLAANWDKVWPWLKQTASGFMAWFSGLPSRFVTFGANLIQGLIDGVTGKLAALKDAVVGAASSAAAWFKKALGIRSPSRLFARFGDDTMAGLAIGLERSSRVPAAAAAAAAAAVAAAGSPAVAAPLPEPPGEDARPDPRGEEPRPSPSSSPPPAAFRLAADDARIENARSKPPHSRDARTTPPSSVSAVFRIAAAGAPATAPSAPEPAEGVAPDKQRRQDERSPAKPEPASAVFRLAAADARTVETAPAREALVFAPPSPIAGAGGRRSRSAGSGAPSFAGATFNIAITPHPGQDARSIVDELMRRVGGLAPSVSGLGDFTSSDFEE